MALSATFGVLSLRGSMSVVALAMAIGGILMVRRVAETMSHKITPMTHGQGLTANLVTAFLVIVASRMGVPVSTTHVSCGSLFGLGLANGKAHWNVIGGIVGAWVLTLPAAAVSAMGIYLICQIF